jgi:hypothetical protein
LENYWSLFEQVWRMGWVELCCQRVGLVVCLMV